MLIQERYDRMDILTYGNDREKKGARQQMESDARRMFAKGISPKDIAEIQEVSLEVIKEILGLQPACV